MDYSYECYGNNDNSDDYLHVGYHKNHSAEFKAMRANRPVFETDHSYYDFWARFDRIIERINCYSILRDGFWMNIPKKIVREVKDGQMLVYRPIFDKIYEKKCGTYRVGRY
jgi:hypothetical protein